VEPNRNHLSRTLAVLLLFGVSFGYVEATVVVYLGKLYEPLALQLDPKRRPGDRFPLITHEQLEATDSAHLRLLKTEVIREAATMVMLASIGLAVAWNFNTWVAGFVIAFGVWDIFYYVFLKVLIDWPRSLLEWDLLFLIPLPWVSPVLAPVVVSLSMIVAGTLLLWLEWADRPVRIGWQHWSTIVLGGLIIIVAFCWDYRQVMAGGIPNPFQWSIFLIGEAIGLAGFALALNRGNYTRHRAST
jgi:hypothetical protein